MAYFPFTFDSQHAHVHGCLGKLRFIATSNRMKLIFFEFGENLVDPYDFEEEILRNQNCVELRVICTVLKAALGNFLIGQMPIKMVEFCSQVHSSFETAFFRLIAYRISFLR